MCLFTWLKQAKVSVLTHGKLRKKNISLQNEGIRALCKLNSSLAHTMRKFTTPTTFVSLAVMQYIGLEFNALRASDPGPSSQPPQVDRWREGRHSSAAATVTTCTCAVKGGQVLPHTYIRKRKNLSKLLTNMLLCRTHVALLWEFGQNTYISVTPTSYGL